MEAHLRVDIEGKPASRPRFTRNGRAYTAPNYANYLKELSAVLKPLETKQIIAGDWNELEVKFYFCYPVMDVMQKLGWIEDDRQIAKLSVAKLQGELEPHIEISLYQ